MRETVDYRVAYDMNCDTVETSQQRAEPVEGDLLRLHQHQELVDPKVWRGRLDDRGGRVDDIAWGKQNLAAIARNDLHLLLSLRMETARLVFVPLGKIVRLQFGEVVNRRWVFVDDHIIDGFQCREIQRAQILRHEWSMRGFVDVSVRGQRGNENVRLTLRVQQVADMAGMHQVEDAMAHDHGLLP